jgi:hypothetical protein
MSVTREHIPQEEFEQALAELREAWVKTEKRVSADDLTGSGFLTDRLASYGLPVFLSVFAAAALAGLFFWSWGPSTEIQSPSTSQSAAAAPSLPSSEQHIITGTAHAETTTDRHETSSIAQIAPQPWPPSLTAPAPAIRGVNASEANGWSASSSSSASNTLANASGGDSKTEKTHDAATSQRPAATSQGPAAASQRPAKTLGPTEASALAKRADALLAARDVSGARLILRLLADSGNGRAAYLLAQTYDPAVLQQNRTIGIQGDSSRARQWYETAQNLGYAEAAEALQAKPVQTVGGR